jgi:hypothetical protein
VKIGVLKKVCRRRCVEYWCVKAWCEEDWCVVNRCDQGVILVCCDIGVL